MASQTRNLSALVLVTCISVALVYRYIYPGQQQSHINIPPKSPSAPPPDPVKDIDYGFDIEAVEKQARRLATHSWEYGTLAEALLELHDPDLSVFSPSAFPADKVPPASSLANSTALEYATPYIRLDSETLIQDDWGVSDPAALGVSAILLGQGDAAYLDAARRQKDYLLKQAPRYENGAISHRKDVKELWADAVHMVPPFLAYYAVVSNDLDLMREAVKQCGLYREILMKKHGFKGGLWRHIVGPSEKQDLGFWSTGNAWAAMGMARVLATIEHWRPAKQALREERELLVLCLQEIVDAAMRIDDDASGLLRNYLGDQGWFGEVSGTALLAATVYRMALLVPAVFNEERMRYVEWADKKRKVIMQSVSEEGIAKPAVQPLDHLLREPLLSGSPEGQSFVLEMAAAWRDYTYS